MSQKLGFDVEAFNTALARPIESSPEFEEWQKAKIMRENRLAGLYDAELIFNHLTEEVQEFEENLEENQEVAIKLANFGEAAQINIRNISFQNPNIIEFHGVNAEGTSVTLLQHISQLNFMLLATKPVEEKPYRIGFLADHDDDDEDDDD